MKFNSSGITIDYIKGLLKDTHIPMIQYYRGQLVRNRMYIKGNKIYKAVLETTPTQHLVLVEQTDYVFGKEYKGLTVNYQSKENYWSKTDHYYLWKYLIMIREFYGQDYLYMFNCWNGGSLNSVDGIRFITVPVENNQIYTLFIDCDIAVYMQQGNKKESFGSMSVGNPVTFTTTSDEDLEIQLPNYVNRVKIVEGDYSRFAREYYRTEWTPNKTIQVQVGIGEAFDNRLIQYLANHIIGTRQVKHSIRQAQEKLKLAPTGIWNEEQFVHNHYARKGFYTQHGEIDKDMQNV